MPARLLRLLPAAMLALAAAACAARNQAPVALNGDDDAFCRAGGAAVGSSEYVACRKDRDAQRGAAITRADRRQRDLGEYMLNHPERP